MHGALITGGSRGLGLALAERLVAEGWSVVIDGRDPVALDTAVRRLRSRARGSVVGIAGDVADPDHRADLTAAVRNLERLDLVVNNASILGPSPQPKLADYPLDIYEDVLRVNLVAPLALLQATLPQLREGHGVVVNITSDAAVQDYEGWGGYGSSKAGLEQLSRVLAAEEPDVRVYWFDPGDMRTQMHQEAFPGEDISDRPLPDTVVPAVIQLLRSSPPSGRVRRSDVAEVEP